MTISEELYDRYCQELGYVVEVIPTASTQTPDRLITSPSSKLVAEIKELTPNEDDLRYMRELTEQGCSSRGGTPGSRVFEKIRSAAPQLKKRSHLGVPCILVLYDNVRDGHWRIGDAYLESSMIDFGMYGLQTVVLAHEPSEDEAGYVPAGSGRGGRRQMSEDERVYISAVQVLYDVAESRAELFTITYHNYFAKAPLPLDAFRGPRDRHFIKPDHPGRTPQQWQEAHASAV